MTPPGLPLYITENGAASYDYVNPDGTIEDPERIDYLHGHLRAARRAIGAGPSCADTSPGR